MSHFIKQGSTWFVTETANLDIHDSLPVGTYVVQLHPEKGYYLSEMDRMTIPDKIYGSLPSWAKRIINTYQSRSSNTGVLLVGIKGSGKTMLARELSLMCLELQIPTITINAPWTGDAFNKFMQNINQPCLVMLDEFEKVYKNIPHDEVNPQEHMLTLLDGVFTSKKLFVLTCNDPWKIDEHMRNRPGRLFYRIDFKGMEEAAIREYCCDVLKHKEWTDKIVRISQAFSSFNFDMLKALVEECNRYDEEPKVAIKLLNMTPESSGDAYDCGVSYKGQVLDAAHINVDYYEGSPLAQPKMMLRINIPVDKALANAVTGSKNANSRRKAVGLKSLLGISGSSAGTGSGGGSGIGIPIEFDSLDDAQVNGLDDQERVWLSIGFDGSQPKSIANGIIVYEPHKDVVITFTRQAIRTFNFDAF